MKIKIFRNVSDDNLLEAMVNGFLNNDNIDIININYLATSSKGAITIIIQYEDNK